jgi:hypothetical protein
VPDERLATPVTLGPFVLPPCDQPAPFDKDDRIVWRIRCGLQQTLKDAGAQRLARLAADIDAWTLDARAECAAGLAVGTGGAVRDGVLRAINDLSALVGRAAKTIASGASTAFDPQTWVGIQKVMSAPPDSDESRQAIEDTMHLVGDDHQDFMEALMMAGAICEALRQLTAWVARDPNAPMRILETLASSLGGLLGEIARQLSEASTPYDVGTVIGDLAGTILIEVVRFYFGF